MTWQLIGNIKGRDGKDASPVDIPVVVAEVVSKIPIPRDGKDISVDAVREIVSAEVAKAVATIPPAKNGIDGKDGQSVHPDTVSLMIVNEVKQAVAAIPKAADGRDALEIDILPAIPPKSVLRGTFVQHKGGLWRAKRETGGGLTWVADEWDLIINGLRNVSVVQLENQRSFGIEIELANGLKETSVISVPVLIYREIFRDGTEYEKGDVVTFGGCAWHCNTDKTKAKPGNGSADWKLMVKEGRAGKDGVNGKDGARGPDGPRGKDLTQYGSDGLKH